MMITLLLIACSAAPDTALVCHESTRTCWWDADGDGYGVEPYAICTDPYEARPEGCRIWGGDCDDDDVTVYPGLGCPCVSETPECQP